MKHNNFNDVESKYLRAYNRAVMAFNLLEQYSEEECENYLGQFTETQKAAIHAILLAIKIYGPEAVEKKVMADVQIH